MPKATHTPGPWALTVFTKADGTPIETVEDVAQTVAHSARHEGGVAELWGVTVPGSGDVIAYTGNGPTREANARLISASPDLLSACEQGLACIGRSLLEDGETLEVSDVLRAAIAKATGE